MNAQIVFERQFDSSTPHALKNAVHATSF